MRPGLLLLVLVGSASLLQAEDAPYKTYTSKAGRFSVLWPGIPTVSESKISGTDRVKTSYRTANPGGDIKFLMLDVADLTDVEAKAGLPANYRGVKEGMLARLKGLAKVVAENDVTLGKDKLPARDLIVDVEGRGRAQVRVCVHGGRIYALAVLASKETLAGKTMMEFFDSLAPTR